MLSNSIEVDFSLTTNEVAKAINETISNSKLEKGSSISDPIQVKGTDMIVSVQGSAYHYSLPRYDDVFYEAVELGFPNFRFSDAFIKKYADEIDSPNETIYPYVVLTDFIEEIKSLI